MLALDPGHVVEDLEVVLVGDERLVTVRPRFLMFWNVICDIADVDVIEIDAGQSHGNGRIGP